MCVNTETEDLFTTDVVGNLAIKTQHRVNKREKPFVRTLNMGEFIARHIHKTTKGGKT